MKSFRTCLISLSLLLIACANAAKSDVRSSIESQYKRWATAALKNDVEGVLDILAPGYTLKAYDGTVIPLAKYEVSLRKRKASGQKPNAYTTSIESLEENGRSVEVISLETTITDTTDPVTNKVQKLIHIHQYLDSWVRLSGRWRLQSTVTKVEKTTIAKQ